MTAVAQLAWLAMTCWWLVWQRMRPKPQGASFGHACVACALALGGATVWALLPAYDGHDAPSVKVELRSIALPSQQSWRVGFSPVASVHLPASYRVPEAARAGMLFRLQRRGRRLAMYPEIGGDTSTRLVGVQVDSTRRLAALATELSQTSRRRCRAATRTLPGDGVGYESSDGIALVLCVGSQPRLAFVAKRSSAGHGDARAHTRLSVLRWRSGRFVPHYIDVAGVTALQMGSVSTPVPSLPYWRLPAQSGGQYLLAVPNRIDAGCLTWQQAQQPGDAPPAAAGSLVDECEFQVGAYTMAAVPFRADVAGIALRTLPTLLMLFGPLLWFVVVSRRDGALAFRDAQNCFAVAIVLSAVLCARWLWAHRVDVIREHIGFGSRAEINALVVAGVGGALCAVLVLRASRRWGAYAWGRALWLASGWAGLGLWLLPGPFQRIPGYWLVFALAWSAMAWIPSLALWSRGFWERYGGGWFRWGLVIVIGGAAVLLAEAVLPSRLGIARLYMVCAMTTLGYFHALSWARGRSLFFGAATVVLVSIATLVVFRIDAGVATILLVPSLLATTLFSVRACGYAEAGSRWLFRSYLGLSLAALVGAAYVTSSAGFVVPGLVLSMAIAVVVTGVSLRRLATPSVLTISGVALFVAIFTVAFVVGGETLGAGQSRIAAIFQPATLALDDPDSFLRYVGTARETAIDGGRIWVGEGAFRASLSDTGSLLSLDNDYFPILLLRDTGVLGVLSHAGLLGVVVGVTMMVTARGGSGEFSSLRVFIVPLAILGVYQPAAAWGLLPLTGVSWPFFGLDSPSDFWFWSALLLMGLRGSHLSKAVTRQPGAKAKAARPRSLVVVLGAGVFIVVAAHSAASRGEHFVPKVGAMAAVEDYLDDMRCGRIEDGVPGQFLGHQGSASIRRFHARLQRYWQSQRPAVRDALSECRAPGPSWSATGSERCELRTRFGAVQISLVRELDAAGQTELSCHVHGDRRLTRAFAASRRVRPQKAMMRLVSRPVGIEGKAVAELISDSAVVRVFTEGSRVEASALHAGLVRAGQVVLAGGLTLEVAFGKLFMTSTKGSQSTVFERHQGRWRRRMARGWISGRALIVDLGQDGRPGRVWLLRAVRGGTSLLADNLLTLGASRSRRYLHGASIPELGWINRFRPRHSLGIDGWAYAAVAAPNTHTASDICGSLGAPVHNRGGVCTTTSDDTIVCSTALQPALSIRLRHLTELVTLAPQDFVGRKYAKRSPISGSYVALRSDTGEILAQGEHVVGRASSVFAPANRDIERALIRAREDRDIRTGGRLPRHKRGESSAERADWNRTIGIGSTMKAVFAQAFELTAPNLVPVLTLEGRRSPAAWCRRTRTHAVLGHCPPTDSLWNRQGVAGFRDYLSKSINWYHAAVGFLAPAAPSGWLGYSPGYDFPLWTIPYAVGEIPVANRVWIHSGEDTVIGHRGRVDIAALRASPFWRRYEAIVGRPLCELGNKRDCDRVAGLRDLCATRSLPIANPSADLRRLVATGPDSFNFYPRYRDPKYQAESVTSTEYLQFLRGSSVHGLGSLIQVADAFNRVIFESDRDPLVSGGYRVAASWFPNPRAITTLPPACHQSAATNQTRQGLCDVVRRGTAASLKGYFDRRRRIILYGAKTGTIDSLGDIAARREDCADFNRAHTIAGVADKSAQRYWLQCGSKSRAQDSLILLSVGIDLGTEIIPITLGLRFRGGSLGLASRVATYYLDIVEDYIAGDSSE